VKIAVCIKRVPVMEVKFAITADGSRYDEAGLKYDINDFDLWAIEAALQLKEKAGAGSVHVLCLGPNAAQEQIRKAMAMGADSGTLLETDARVYDGLAVARALAAELKDGGYDLVLFGRIAIDSMNQMTGPMVAELLGLPVVTNVFKLDSGRTGRAERVLEGASESGGVSAASRAHDRRRPQQGTPAVAQGHHGGQEEAARRQAGRPRRAGRREVRRMALPPERAAGRIVGEGAAAVPELVRLLQTEAKVL
jgi:electron transfer flavoprotein beta subunit